MTEPEDAAESAVTEADSWVRPDPLLQTFAGMTNTTGLELGIRLHLAGQVVSGVLISGSRFFELLSEQVLGGDAEPIRKALSDGIKKLGEGYQQRYWPSESDSSSREPFKESVGYLHLKDAYAYQSDGRPLPLGLWRCKAVDVAAWGFGNYSTPGK